MSRRSRAAATFWAPLSVLLVAVLSTACASAPRRLTPYDLALRQIHVQSAHLAWGDLVVGTTFERVERAVGQRLPSPRAERRRCPDDYVVRVSYLREELILTFSGTTSQARLKEVALSLPPGFEVGPVAAALEARLRGLVEERSSRGIVYRADGAGRVVVDPAVGVRVGDVCLP